MTRAPQADPTGLLLIDHGSRRSEANLLLAEIAEKLQASRPDTIVEFAHLEIAEPCIEAGLAACVTRGARRIVAVPFMLAPGKHVTIDIPARLEAATKNHPGVQVELTPPLAAHPQIQDFVMAVFDSHGE